MSNEHESWEQIKDIAASALELPRDKREAFINEQCEGKPDLLTSVMSLVMSDDTDDVISGELDILVGAAPLPDVSLVAAEWAVVRSICERRASVITEKDDQRILGVPSPLQLRQQASDVVIHR